MSKWLLILLLGITSHACGKEPYSPLVENKDYYYALIEIPESANPNLYYEALKDELKPYQTYQVSKIFFDLEKFRFFVIRRFEREQEGKKLIRKLSSNRSLSAAEMRVVSQSQFREILQQTSK